jgi:hypothetical protein
MVSAEVDDISDIIYNIVDWLVGVGAAVTVLMFVWGGFTFATASGDEKKVTQGREVLKWAVIGLLVILSAYAIESVVQGFVN